MAVECTYCEEKVNANRGIYIKCTTCQEIKLCLECFSAGATIGDHESDHPYELIDCGSFSIIDESWKAFEELALLEAIELYGIGSWTDIANAVETRSAEECCERYLRVYVDNFFGRSSWNAIERDLYTVHDHTCTHSQPLSPSLSLPERHKIVDITKEQQVRLGYMPRRDDFEREWSNDAELLVSKLAVNANDDTDLDQDLKVAHINMYTDKLRERFRRKRIVLEYNLVKLFFHMHPEENTNGANQGLLNINNSTTTSHLKPPEPIASITDSTTAVQTKASNNILPDRTSLSYLSNGKDPKTLSSDSHSNHKLNHNTPSSDDSTANEKTNNHNSVQNTILNYFRRIEPTPSLNGSVKDSSSFSNNTNTTTTTAATSTSTSSSSSSSNTTTNQQGNSILLSFFSDYNRSIAEQDFNSMEKKLRIFCQFSSAEDHNRLIRNLAREKELKVKIKDLIRKRKSGQKYHTNSSTSINGIEGDTFAGNKQSPSTNKKNPTKSVSVASSNSEPMDVDMIDEKSTAASNTLSPTKVTQKKNGNGKNTESTKAIMNFHLNQNSEPNWRLLSESEKRLCKSNNLKPSQYISFKTHIIKEHNHKKKKKGASQRLFTEDIDKTVKRRIVDFLTRNNWIKV